MSTSITDSVAQVLVFSPETYSHREDPNGDTIFLDPNNKNHIIAGNYYGYPTGARTAFDSSPFKEFSLHEVNNEGDPVYPWTWQKMNFRLKFPEDYDPADNTKKYPMMVFMHGAGERANCWGNNCYKPYDWDPVANPNGADLKNYNNNDHQLYHGGHKHLLAGQTKLFDGFILYPQNNDSWYWPDRFSVEDIIEELIEYEQVDDTRIYIHGLSNGVNATWQMISYR
ncbi:MAG: hypothetical protein R3345_11215, partial [Fulvivirga sp.]|nr:hypothetical protein [Fulvivirga sp.]